MSDNPLGYEKIPKLLKSFAIPSIMATLVGSIYNIVDQIFIGQGVGYLGNAATNVSYPVSTICLAISLLIGIGITLMLICGLAYLAIGESLLNPLLKLFGATKDVLPYAQQYAGITLIGIPFYYNVFRNKSFPCLETVISCILNLPFCICAYFYLWCW